MQFTKFTAILAIAATASAVAIETRNGGETTICKDKDGKCHKSKPDDCTSKGGEPYKCTTIGLLNLLDCFSLLDNNEITIPITVDLL